jgi:uncharacterized protein (TIRG00374 family)
VGALGLFLLTPLAASYRWQLLARPLGFVHRLRRFTGIYFLGMFFNLLLPTSVGGDVVRTFYLDAGRHRKMDAFLCVVVDRATGLLMLIAMACCATLIQLRELPVWATATVWAAAVAVLGGLFILPFIARLLERWHRDHHHPAGARKDWRYWLRRIAALPSGLLEAFAKYRNRPGLIAFTCLLSLGIMAANVIVVWMLCIALGGTVPGAYFWVAVPVVTLLTLVPISINGMGVREAGMGVAVLLFGLYVIAGLIGAAIYMSGSFPRLPADLAVLNDNGGAPGNEPAGAASTSAPAA